MCKGKEQGLHGKRKMRQKFLYLALLIGSVIFTRAKNRIHISSSFSQNLFPSFIHITLPSIHTSKKKNLLYEKVGGKYDLKAMVV